nr:putative ribonuclease H-like domain-containing protein [Tanacetum cinerariifolium]
MRSINTAGQSLSKHSIFEVDRTNHQSLEADSGSSPSAYSIPDSQCTSGMIPSFFLTDKTGAPQGSGPDWLFDFDALTRTRSYEPVVVDEDPRKENERNDQEKEDNVNITNNVNTVSSTVKAAGTNKDNKLLFDPNMPALEDVSIFNFSSDDKDDEVKNASTPMETQKPLLKDEDGEEVNVYMYRLMIGSFMYLTSSRPNIMFAVCACARYQVNPKVSHLYAVKRIFSKLGYEVYNKRLSIP